MEWSVTPELAEAVTQLRTLANVGLLAETVARSTVEERRLWNAAAYAVAGPLVFRRITRPNEQRRGHWTCANAVAGLADSCLDRFHDDVQAVIDDLFARATLPIHNLEGWIVPRLRKATIDAHRRWRGSRGALQRPRLPGWLATSLRGDPWLSQLAIEILTWVGVSATSGTSLWPLDSWAERRALTTLDWVNSDAGTVAREVEYVLSAMRRYPKWYEDYVERPLARKIPPVGPGAMASWVTSVEPTALALASEHEVEDARLHELAASALEVIEAGLAAGHDARSTVVAVIHAVFGGEEESGVPLDEPMQMDRIVRVVLDIVFRGRVDEGRSAA